MVSLTNFRTFGELAPESNALGPNYLDTTPRETVSGELKSFGGHICGPGNGAQKAAPAEVELGLGKLATVSEKAASNKHHFEVRWSNLTYKVEPKWYHRLQLNSSAGGGSYASSSGSSTSSTITASSARATRQEPVKKSILCNLNGSVKSGQVTAVLGPSGAGKTSLLGCLTGKNKSGVSGAVQVIPAQRQQLSVDKLGGQRLGELGGEGAAKSCLSTLVGNFQEDEGRPMQICTIPQKDYLLNQLTVRENLWFASRLKHPEENFDHDSNIDRVVDLLKLDTCIDTKISKISGGQYKRVSIAQELLSNPDILILDEPTSGLDSLTCYKTVMVLRDLARLSPNPMAIIVTIHQPQREVFDLFNHIYILAIGGRCIYEGHPSQSIRTINECSGGLHFDADQYNPASYLVEIASAEFGEKPIEALVEHQRREFKRRVLEQLLSSTTKTTGQQQLSELQRDQQQMAAIAASLTPALKKRNHSPMIARFKSTLSTLTGSSSSSSVALNAASQLELAKAKPLAAHQYAYTNEAYDAASAGHTNGSSTLELRSPSQMEAHQTVGGQLLGSKAVQQPPSTDNNNCQSTFSQDTLFNQKQASQANHLHMYQYASEHFDMHSNGSLDNNQHESNDFYLDERLQTHKHNHKGHFLHHCRLLTKRSWLCLCKDPMLTTLRFSAHIIVPLLITIVYGNRVGKPNACPLYETNMDLIEYARSGAKRLLNLQDELRCTFENVGLYFLSVYAFTFSTMCLTSLSFPLNMHVLLKEVRNGWYSIPTYFIGKTLADFPLEFILPTVTLMITYPLTGQPSSYLEWRFLLATGIFVVTSLIAQTQGLIFGALFMNAMQAAVFVAPVSTTPLILLSGFLIRISQMPIYLQKLSTLSYFRYAIESLTIIRYGFGQCPCDPSVVTGQPVSPVGVPDRLRTMTNYWLSTFENENAPNGDYSVADSLNETLTDIVTTTLAPSLAENLTTSEPAQVDFFQDLTVLLARANSFGADIKTCDDLKPYPMIDFNLEDSQLYVWVAALVATLFISKIVNYIVVKYSVKWRL